MVIRFSCSEEFIEELVNNDIGRAFANPTAFVSKLFSECLVQFSVERLACH